MSFRPAIAVFAKGLIADLGCSADSGSRSTGSTAKAYFRCLRKGGAIQPQLALDYRPPRLYNTICCG